MAYDNISRASFIPEKKLPVHQSNDFSLSHFPDSFLFTGSGFCMERLISIS